MTQDYMTNHYSLPKGRVWKPMAHDAKKQDKKNRIFVYVVVGIVAAMVVLCLL